MSTLERRMEIVRELLASTAGREAIGVLEGIARASLSGVQPYPAFDPGKLNYAFPHDDTLPRRVRSMAEAAGLVLAELLMPELEARAQREERARIVRMIGA